MLCGGVGLMLGWSMSARARGVLHPPHLVEALGSRGSVLGEKNVLAQSRRSTKEIGKMIGPPPMGVELPAHGWRNRRLQDAAALLGPTLVLRQRVAELGLSRGLLQGAGATALKECPSYGVYFLVYEEARRSAERLAWHPVVATLAAGGLAGALPGGRGIVGQTSEWPAFGSSEVGA